MRSLDYHRRPASTTAPFPARLRVFDMPIHSRASNRSHFRKSLLVFSLLIAGCIAPQMVRCPIADADLTKKIFEIAPKGTPRDETIAKLKAAGIDGAFAADRSPMGKDYFCCRSWRRPDSEVWRINLLLHFDKNGEFVETLDLPEFDSARLKPAKSTI
jgi:hypothetical protein